MPVFGPLASIGSWLLNRALRPLHRAWLWLRTWARVLKPCRFPLLMVLAGTVFLLLVPQGQDLLRGLAERVDGTRSDDWQRTFFFGSALLWSVYSWYWSRVMLFLEFPDVPGNEPGLHAFRTHAPRFIGFFASASVAAALYRASFGYADLHDPARLLLERYAFWTLIGAFAFLALASTRRALSRKAYESLRSIGPLQGRVTAPVIGLLAVPASHELVYGTLRVRDLPRGVKVVVGVTLAVVLGLFALFAFALQASAPLIGAAAILLLAAAGWIAAGSVFDTIGLRLRFPVMSALLGLALLFSFWNDNHALRTLPQRPDTWENRATVRQALEDWYARQTLRPSPDGSYPLFLVAAEGGGIRAAYWTASVLAGIQDRNPCFADQLFALSGVSGGSLGAAVFAAQLADAPAGVGGFRCDAHGAAAPDRAPLQESAQQVLAEDFLAPVTGALLYSDLLQRVLPFPVPSFDRARALEGAWERAWQRHMHNNRFAEPFDALWHARRERWMPALLLNSTWVETGKRLIASNLRITPAEFNDAEDLHALYTERALPLSSAVHLSARFTYVSPAGTLEKRGTVYGHAVDGGYFENSGETTIVEILKTLDQLAATRPGWQRVKPVVIHISNEPADPRYLDIHLGTEKKDRASTPLAGLNEILSPPATLLNARTARGVYARETVKWYVGGSQFLHFGLCRDGLAIPLGWVLSDTVREAMRTQLTHNRCVAFDNPANMDTIDRLIAGRYARGAPVKPPARQ